MMTFNFITTKDRLLDSGREVAKNDFIRYIGNLKNEFEESDVIVQINLDAKNNDRIYFINSAKSDIGNLVDKLQQYKKTNPMQ